MISRKNLLKIINTADPQERDEALREHLKLRHSDELWYLLETINNKSLEDLIYRFATENNELLGKLRPNTLEEQMKLEIYVNKLSYLTLEQLEKI